jgi:DNA repair exonuclease SbcCD ATPase subunit
MGATVTHHSHALESDPANHRQAEYFRDELHHQIELLNDHVRKCQAKLAANTRRGQVDQIRHMQAQLRQCAIERRKLLEMLAALTRRFPDNEVALAR